MCCLFCSCYGALRDLPVLPHSSPTLRSSDLAERLYHCVLLVCTFYTPHVHNLGFLRTQAERIDMRLVDAWPRERREDRARFEKLKEAYVKARYSKLCRTRHNFDYAERPTMPSGRANALLSTNFALIGIIAIKIGRAHVCTPVTNAHLVCRLLLAK